jgi:hypothetical protein
MKADKIIGAVEAVTASWAKQRKAEERSAAALANRRYAMTRFREPDNTLKSAAWTIMKTAYLKASANGALPALARQIMYAARPYIQEKTGKPLSDKYFTQTLLPDYVDANADECANWNVAFDARGHFIEPHTGYEVPLGTMQVCDYLHRVANHEVVPPNYSVSGGLYPTLGPAHRYSTILFIEKEGFGPLFKAVRLAERYDIGVMSTKGMSVTAARKLIDTLCADHGIRLLVVHDFDKSGFSIFGTIRESNRRYRYQNQIEVVDVGMRIEDIGDLPREAATPVKNKFKAKLNLKANGATPEEIDFLLNERVELNAFSSDALVAWVEAKLDKLGVKKLIPDDTTLADAYRRLSEQAAIQKMIDEAVINLRKTVTAAPVPDNLRTLIAERLRADNAHTWDAVIADIIEEREAAA